MALWAKQKFLRVVVFVLINSPPIVIVMRNALPPVLLFLSALMFSATGLAEDTSLEPGLQLQLDDRLSLDLPPRTGQAPHQNLLLDSSPQADQDISFRPDYQLGQGWRRGNFYMSGYGNIKAGAPLGEPAELVLDDLSLFVGGHVNKWVNPFMELEISEHILIQQGGGPRGNGYVLVERLYNDFTLLENDTLRVGKILAPVGNWNQIHAAPLVPTNTRPLTTYQSFSKYATGVSWLHEQTDDFPLEWHLYLAPGSEVPRRPRDLAPRNYRNVAGGHINMPLGLVDKVGISLQRGKLMESGETFTLYGFNVIKSFGKLRLESEGISSRWSGATPRVHDRESGIFALADYTFAPRWHGILEWERYQDHEAALPSRNVLAGVSYRPSPIVWKLEYVRQMGESPYISSGWQASISTMF